MADGEVELGTEVRPSGAYPVARCKVIHLVRHGQATHNKARVDFPNDNVYVSEAYFDANLTELGWQQTQFVREHIASSNAIKPQLVVTSPLSRCIQTAIGVFGLGNPVHPWDPSCPRFAAVEHCREHMGMHPCDRRRSVSELEVQYPFVDFSALVSDEDVLWKPDARERDEDVQHRAASFANWLCNRSEQRIAVVTHSGFIWALTRLFGEDLTGKVRHELQGGYANCELRSVVLVDKQGIGQPFGRTDFPGCSPKYVPGQ